MSECEVWITNGNGTDCFIVGGLTRAEALIVKDNIEYGGLGDVTIRPVTITPPIGKPANPRS